jgi:hypothetical protein
VVLLLRFLPSTTSTLPPLKDTRADYTPPRSHPCSEEVVRQALGAVNEHVLPLFQNSITFCCRFSSLEYPALCLKPITLSNRASCQLSKTGIRLFERAVVAEIRCCEHFPGVTCRKKPLRPCQQWNGLQATRVQTKECLQSESEGRLLR